MKRVTLLAGFVFIYACVFGQSATDLIPKMAPSSPEAAAFTKYGNYDVNLFTGIPDISIPIYEIQIGQLKVPITLSYHAGGIKVSEMASRAGLGWDLQAGGSITRKVMDKPDELINNYLDGTPTQDFRVRNASEINTTSDSSMTYLDHCRKGLYDLQPDIFSYSVPGHSGKFLFNQRDSFKTFLIPSAPVMINHTKPTASTLSLNMTDENGIHYNFDSMEATSVGGGISVTATSAWLLTKMKSANQQDSITFNYSPSPYGFGITDTYFSDYDVINDEVSGDYTSDFGTLYGDLATIGTNWKQLNEIDFKNGKVVFESAPETRRDFGSIYKLQNRISAVKIYSYSAATSVYTLIRSVKFFHSYFISGTDTTTRRLRLDSIQILSATNIAVQTYRFGYNSSIDLPNNLTREKDYWGFYNAQYNYDPNSPGHAPTMIPQMVVPYKASLTGTPGTHTIGGTNANARITDSAYMRAYILQQITYPTEGYTTFQYETNQYLDDNGTAQFAGGLRIKSISSYSSSSATPIVKIYNYGNGESGYGRANFLLEEHFFMSFQSYRQSGYYYGDGECRSISYKTTRTYFANPTNDLEGYDGAPVVYPVVTEYQINGTANNGKTVYTFLDKPDAKTDIIGLGKAIFDSYHFLRGFVINKQVYRTNGYGGYSLVTENRKKYQYFTSQWTTGGAGLAVFKTMVTQGPGSPDNYCGVQYNDGCHTFNDFGNFQFNNYDIVSGDNKLVADSVLTYDPNDSTKIDSVITSYMYDDIGHLQDTLTQTTNSKNEIIKTTYKYPYNYGSAPYTTMTSSHIYNAMVQETVTNNVSGQLTQKTSNYASFTGNNYLPSTIQLQVKSNAVETRASFNQYDVRGNILEMQKTNDVKQSYIWDYQGLMPVAEVINAAQADVAYTSFESDGKGNWTFAGTPVADATAPTGGMAYNLNNDSLKKTGLTSGNKYVVSYWSKNGAYTVSGTGSAYKTGKTINGWTYYEDTTTASGTSIKISAGTGTHYIDEVRLYPTTAQMNTYTYTPLTGMTAHCDLNNRITYYEYDFIGRLKVIRDQDRNVLKRICYTYTGQTSACLPAAPVTITYSNDGYAGFSAVYTNTVTGDVTTFTVPTVSGSGTLGIVPSGTYNITISKPGNTDVMIGYQVCTGSAGSSGLSASFSNIVVSPAGICNNLTIYDLH